MASRSTIWRHRKQFFERRWKPTEDVMLLEMRRRGLTSGQIAFRIPRSPNAILARLRLLKMRGEDAR